MKYELTFERSTIEKNFPLYRRIHGSFNSARQEARRVLYLLYEMHCLGIGLEPSCYRACIRTPDRLIYLPMVDERPT